MLLGRFTPLLPALVLAIACGESYSVDGDEPDASIMFDATVPDGGPGPQCGDGNLDPGEECDDGNTTGGDDCSATCTVEADCGNGRLQPGEQCDDGNIDSGDGCDATCRREAFCGDGNVDAGEVCDDGGNFSGDGCRSDCQSDETCGNGIVDSAAGELCDDGNTMDGDGCSSTCTVVEMCGDMMMSSTEECDDGNVTRFDGCGPDCVIERSLVVNSLLFGDRTVGCDYSGDGEPDNQFAAALGSLAPLVNDMFLADAPANGDLLLALHMLGLDDPTAANDPSFSIAFMQANDPDGNPDNNLTGMGTLEADPNAFDAAGRPLTAFASRVSSSMLVGGPEDILLPIGFLPIELRRGQIRGTTTAAGGELTGLTDGVLCGAVPASTIAVLPNIIDMFTGSDAEPCDGSTTPTSLADVLIGGTPDGFIFPLRGSAPDVDLDGDGLERFEVTSTGPRGCQPVVTACIDGDGTRVEGRDCVMDPDFQDGWSAGFELTAVRVNLVAP
ncbi:MAG: hypothetical protein CMN30_14815 [Sandaracinus sp.]|nr:hypothetical protein [Sandaracinus sp.]